MPTFLSQNRSYQLLPCLNRTKSLYLHPILHLLNHLIQHFFSNNFLLFFFFLDYFFLNFLWLFLLKSLFLCLTSFNDFFLINYRLNINPKSFEIIISISINSNTMWALGCELLDWFLYVSWVSCLFCKGIVKFHCSNILFDDKTSTGRHLDFYTCPISYISCQVKYHLLNSLSNFLFFHFCQRANRVIITVNSLYIARYSLWLISPDFISNEESMLKLLSLDELLWN